jgi:hypothetical protein
VSRLPARPVPPTPVLRRPLDAPARATAAGVAVGVAVTAGVVAWYLARVLLAREPAPPRAPGARGARS